MSQARVHHVLKSRRRFRKGSNKPLPNYRCEKCDREIEWSQPYRWFVVGFRSQIKHIRCMDRACTPKRSELESSRLSEAYSSAESCTDEIRDARSLPEIQSALQVLADELTELSEDYRDGATDDKGTTFNPAAEERADALNTAADELRDWTPVTDAPHGCIDHKDSPDVMCNACSMVARAWFGQTQDDAYEAIDMALGEIE